MGFGAGGPSRAGQSTGHSEAESVAVVRQAIEAGVNLIDTSEAYHTEGIVGRAIHGFDRDKLILSTKVRVRGGIAAAEVRSSLEDSLRRLGTDYVDIYHLHAVQRSEYDALYNETVPVLLRLREEGKLRYLGVTERFGADTEHTMLQRALQDDVWDVMMVGFNILNQSARERVFPHTREKGIGVLIMFAVRRALSRPDRLREVVAELVERGEVDPAEVDRDDPLGFVVHEGGAVSVPDAAYRFARYEPGTDVILSGTGNAEHLRANLASFERPPLPEADRQRLERIFRGVDSVAGN
jgi:aryl-alcohol dehydrogenase-like predicted oxidoreductase